MLTLGRFDNFASRSARSQTESQLISQILDTGAPVGTHRVNCLCSGKVIADVLQRCPPGAWQPRTYRLHDGAFELAWLGYARYVCNVC